LPPHCAVIDLVDATGSGDVDTRTKVHTAPLGGLASRDGAASSPLCITGLSGRALTLNPAWENPTGEWRLGLKAAFDVFPKPLRDRVAGRLRKAANTALGELVAEAAR
jgi:tripeptidyl-peptidase-2